MLIGDVNDLNIMLVLVKCDRLLKNGKCFGLLANSKRECLLRDTLYVRPAQQRTPGEPSCKLPSMGYPDRLMRATNPTIVTTIMPNTS